MWKPDRTYTAGENITAYYFETDSTLVFEGTGTMFDWTASSKAPWFGNRVTAAVIGEGITAIGAYAFYGSSLKAITIPDAITEVGEYAFGLCRNAESLSIGSGISEIKEGTFENTLKLKTISVPDDEESELKKCSKINAFSDFWDCGNAHLPRICPGQRAFFKKI